MKEYDLSGFTRVAFDGIYVIDIDEKYKKMFNDIKNENIKDKLYYTLFNRIQDSHKYKEPVFNDQKEREQLIKIAFLTDKGDINEHLLNTSIKLYRKPSSFYSGLTFEDKEYLIDIFKKANNLQDIEICKKITDNLFNSTYCERGQRIRPLCNGIDDIKDLLSKISESISIENIDIKFVEICTKSDVNPYKFFQDRNNIAIQQNISLLINTIDSFRKNLIDEEILDIAFKNNEKGNKTYRQDTVFDFNEKKQIIECGKLIKNGLIDKEILDIISKTYEDNFYGEKAVYNKTSMDIIIGASKKGLSINEIKLISETNNENGHERPRFTTTNMKKLVKELINDNDISDKKENKIEKNIDIEKTLVLN